jgi:predicted nucleic acid-binding protein
MSLYTSDLYFRIASVCVPVAHSKIFSVGLAGIALPEIISAFCRLHREARITNAQYRQLKSLLMTDIEDAALCDLAPEVLAQAISCLENNVLRGMDAIHIGSAVVLKADVFVSSDKRQCEAAGRAGLQIALV